MQSRLAPMGLALLTFGSSESKASPASATALTVSARALGDAAALGDGPSQAAEKTAKDASSHADAAKDAVPVPSSVKDAKLDAWRSELLDLAFRAASKFPLRPHHKNRARDQEVVVATCVELDQLQSALAKSESVSGWTQGFCLAEVAFRLAQQGDRAVAPKLLERALAVGDDAVSGADFQDWQRDRIRVKVAQTKLLLGEPDEAAKLSKDVEPSESGKVDAVNAGLAQAPDFDAEMADVDRVLAARTFDVTRNTLERCVKLYDRFYGDAAKRGAIEDRVRGARTSMPVQPSVGFAVELGTVALAHGDTARALDLVKESIALIESAKWLPEDYLPLRLNVVPLLWKAGKHDEARADLQAATVRFDTERAKIANIWRAGVLRAIAEAYAEIGDTAAAIAAYQRAVEAGVENPNSRPRVDDLVATCCSLARHAVEPPPALRARLVEIVEKLGDPW